MDGTKTRVDILRLLIVSDRDVARINQLLPQLSSHAGTVGREDIESIIQEKSNRLWVAWVGDKIAGTAQLTILTGITGSHGQIDNVVVDASVRGLGLGRKLVQALIDDAKLLNLASVELTSRPERVAANALYQSLGFEIRATNPYRLKLR